MANYPDQFIRLDADKPCVALFVLQASNPDGVPLTSSQIDAARAAAVSVLELLGAEVANNTTLFHVQNQSDGTLRVSVACESLEEE